MKKINDKKSKCEKKETRGKEQKKQKKCVYVRIYKKMTFEKTRMSTKKKKRGKHDKK